jgi:starch phosphorylase
MELMPQRTQPVTTEDSALERRLKRLGLLGDNDDWTDRYLLCEHIVDPGTARARQRFEAIARFTRDLIAHRWVKTRMVREEANPKRVYYLSMEFLIGRMLRNNLMNLAADPLVQRALSRQG